MAGDPVIATLRRVIIDVTTRTVVPLQIPSDPHRSSPCYHVECGNGVLADAQWKADGTQLAFISTSRDHKIAQLRVADASSGVVRTVLEEHAATYYESDISQSNFGAVNWRYLPASNEVIWYSARDDWAHLYLYDLATGKLKHPITRGFWNVIQILKVDEKARQLYFLGVGREPNQSPYFVHLYKIGLDGKHLQLLTPENATHQVVARAHRPLLHRQLLDTRHATSHGSARCQWEIHKRARKGRHCQTYRAGLGPPQHSSR